VHISHVPTPKAPDENSSQERAARLLIIHTALSDLSLDDARVVVGYMRPRRIKMGATLIEEGELRDTDYMVLVIDGEVSVENQAPVHDDSLVMSVMGPGSLIGEMGVLDAAPRSATCIAITDVAAAVLSRDALLRLIEDNPRVSSRLMLAISKSLADRLREANRKIKTMSGLSRALQQELDVAHRPGRLSVKTHAAVPIKRA
jgi:CRP/FNR family transcriptional regulator, cyclic AMP receptor protein